MLPLSGRGLGINQSSPIRYFHASLSPGDVLLLAAHPPAAWNAAALASLYGQSIAYQQSRLLDQVLDASGALLHIKPGSGQALLLPARPVLPQVARAEAPLSPTPASADEYNEDLVRQQAMLDQYQPLPELGTNPEFAQPLASEAVSVSPADKVHARSANSNRAGPGRG